MMTDENERCCAVCATGWLWGKTPAEVIAITAATIHRDDGTPTIQDGGADPWSFSAALVAHGWRTVWPGPDVPIPARSVIFLQGHAFAIDGGKIFDTSSGSEFRDGEDILFFMTPPKTKDDDNDND